MGIILHHFTQQKTANVIIIRVTLKNLEFAQMQDVEKIRRSAYVLYVSKKFFLQRGNWDEIWII